MCDTCYSRRAMLKLSTLMAGTGVAPLLSRPALAQAADAPVRIGYLPITDAAPLLVAHANGLFEAQGLQADKPVLLRSWAQLVEAFVSGQVNVVHLLSPMTLWARFGAKVPAKVVAWNHVNGSALTVRPEINAVADLGGKTVAVPFWFSIHNVVLQDLLRGNGLTPVLKRTGAPDAREVNLVVMAPSDMPPALASGQIAGFIVAEPFDAAAELASVGKILRFTGDVWKDHACCVVFMQDSDIQNRPEWTQKVVNGIVEAQLWIRGHRGETAALLSKTGAGRYTPHPEATLRKVLDPASGEAAAYAAGKAIQHPDWGMRRIDFQPYPFPSYTAELVQRLKATLIDGPHDFLDALDPATAARELVDDRFVRQAMTAHGGPAAFGLPANLERSELVAV